MNDNKTESILQRLPVILAATAASYGLALRVGSHDAKGKSPVNARQALATARR